MYWQTAIYMITVEFSMPKIRRK